MKDKDISALLKSVEMANNQGIPKDSIIFAPGHQLLALGLTDVEPNGLYQIENGVITLIGYPENK